MKKLILAAICAGTLSASASAAPVVLDFTGVANPSNMTNVGGFYNGGTSGDGNTGVNYGVEFSPNALALNNFLGSGNEPNPGILFFLSGASVFINYAAGFTTGFSFFYASSTVSDVSVYDDLNGTGNLLATLSLTDNFVGGCGYCQWDAIGVNFGGTARSIGFAGAADEVGFDQITFGSATAGATGTVPEPGTLALLALGLAGAGALRRRRLQA